MPLSPAAAGGWARIGLGTPAWAEQGRAKQPLTGRPDSPISPASPLGPVGPASPGSPLAPLGPCEPQEQGVGGNQQAGSPPCPSRSLGLSPARLDSPFFRWVPASDPGSDCTKGTGWASGGRGGVSGTGQPPQGPSQGLGGGQPCVHISDTGEWRPNPHIPPHHPFIPSLHHVVSEVWHT